LIILIVQGESNRAMIEVTTTNSIHANPFLRISISFCVLFDRSGGAPKAHGQTGWGGR